MQRLSILALAAAALINIASFAAAETWALNSGSGDWNTAANWSPASVPNGAGASAVFNDATATANRTATLSADTTVGAISFSNSSNHTNTIGTQNTSSPVLTFDADGAGPATITVTGTNGVTSATANTIFAAVVLNDDVVVDVTRGTTTSAAGEFTFRSLTVSGPGGITKNGTGILTIADSPKDYTGPTIINNGRFRLNGTANMTGTSAITVNSGGQLDLEGALDYNFGSGAASPPSDTVITLNGFGLGPTSPAGNFPGAIRTGSGLLQYIENKIVLGSAASINVVSGANGSPQGKLNLMNEVSGPGRLVANQKAGLISREGFLYLGHSNSYTGGTTVEQGTLTVGVVLLGTLLDPTANVGTGNVYIDGVLPAADSNPDGASSGKLAIESGVTNAIADTAYLYLTGGGASGIADRGFAILGSGVNDAIGGLMVGGSAGAGGLILGPGTYGSSTSGAPNPGLSNPDEYFSGPGTVTVVPAGLPGDFNNDGVVDAGDYATWRKGGPLANDFTPGNQPEDYTFWRSRFGAGTNPASGSGLSTSTVPEPAGLALIATLVSLLPVARRDRPLPPCSVCRAAKGPG